MAKSKRQKELTAQVQERLLSEGPVRVDASAVKTGGEKGGTKRLSGIHPSLEGATQALDEAGLRSGTITTPSGLSVQVTKGARAQNYEPLGQGLSEERKGSTLPPVQEGVSQRYEQRIGHEHSEARVAELTAEADAVARRPNPLRSDGHVDMLVGLNTPSIGGNRLGRGGSLSALAKLDDVHQPQSKISLPKVDKDTASNFPSLKNGPLVSGYRDLALLSLGYTDEVQSAMLKTARDRIQRRQGRGQVAALTEHEVAARAYQQVNEHLDEALHGTRRTSRNRNEEMIADLADQQAAGSRGFGVTTETSRDTATPGGRERKGGGLGMTAKRTPEQRAQRKAVMALTRQRGGWAALQNADHVAEAVQNDLDLLTAKQKARRAGAIAPEERVTDSAGAHPEQKARRHAQPVFSTSDPGVGIPSEAKGRIIPTSARPGAVSPIPPNLPTEPAKIGRTREERGVSTPRNYGPAIAAYEASRPQVTPKSQRGSAGQTAVPAAESNVAVAQTATVTPRSTKKKAA